MKAKFGAIVVAGSGKLGGHVASKNRSGAYFRTKVTPINPQSSAQVGARAVLTLLAQNWRGLTEGERTAWNSAVQGFKSTNIFGDIVNPSGLNLYTRLNANILNGGGTVITAPPAPGEAPNYITFSAVGDESGQTLAVTFSPSPVPANTAYILEATEQVSPGVTFLKNKYRKLKTIAAAATSPNAAGAAYIARFGALVAGQKIGLRMKAIDLTTGLVSQATSAIITVVP